MKDPLGEGSERNQLRCGVFHPGGDHIIIGTSPASSGECNSRIQIYPPPFFKLALWKFDHKVVLDREKSGEGPKSAISMVRKLDSVFVTNDLRPLIRPLISCHAQFYIMTVVWIFRHVEDIFARAQKFGYHTKTFTK